jgi:hypothetical protein
MLCSDVTLFSEGAMKERFRLAQTEVPSKFRGSGRRETELKFD